MKLIQFNGYISMQFGQLLRPDKNKSLFYDIDNGLLLYKADSKTFDKLHSQKTNLKKLLRILTTYDDGVESRLSNKERSAIKLIKSQLVRSDKNKTKRGLLNLFK